MKRNLYILFFRRRPGRRGMVLVVVLVVIALLTLAGYTYSELMFAEREATQVYGRAAETRALADSGVEMATIFLNQSEQLRQEAGGVYDNPTRFRGVLVQDEGDPQSRGRFTLVAPVEDEQGNAGGVRFGLENESTRLNLNVVSAIDAQQPGAGRTILMALPGMTEDIADAILDWMDTDDEPREFGAEIDYYAGLDPPYAPANAPLQSIEELLLVRGVTPELLFGADTNHNGMIDANEDASFSAATTAGFGSGSNNQKSSTSASGTSTTAAGGASTGGGTNTAGTSGTGGSGTTGTTAESDTTGGNTESGGSYLTSNRGWAAYLTLASKESNKRPNLVARIDLNGDDMEKLYDDLEQAFGAQWATFIVAYRQNGPYTGTNQTTSTGTNQTTSTGTNQPTGEASGQLDLTVAGKTKLKTVLDLIGARTQAQFQGTTTKVVLETPFPSDPVSMNVYLPTLMDNVTINPAETISGRININQASRAVLQGIPGMTPEIVDGIIANRVPEATSDKPSQRHETWLLSEGIVTLDEMKALMPYITSSGSVFRTQVVGYFEQGGPATRIEVILDATTKPPKVLSWKDLSHLGPGYRPETLGVAAPEL